MTSVSGTNPTLDVKLQSDVDGFGSPADQITFSQAIAIGSQWGTPASGAVTDTYYRLNYTIGGTDTPTFSFIVVMAIF